MTIDKDGLAGLLERVREAKGPDRELDLDIAAALFTDGEDAAWWQRRKERFLSSHMLVDAAPPYTASIDAALALVERVAGGYGDQPLVYNFELGWHASAHDHMAYTADLFVADGDPAVMLSYQAQAHTLPLAILAALLTALKEVR